MSRQVVYLFSETIDRSSQEIGGKGSGLAEMVALGLPVPAGFTVSTTVARAYQQEGRLPRRFAWQFNRGISAIERATGRKLGDSQNPLLVSVRSGAAKSMPGMMDTVLNVGKGGREEVLSALEAVFHSWENERALAYRESKNIPEWWGTAVTVQAMVFGNAGDHSCTGVAFSHNTINGYEGLYGEFLVNAQGEELVSGSKTPRPITEMEEWNVDAYQELEEHVRMLSKYHNDIVDVEFTVERGKLYLLQVRVAKRTPEAAVTFAVRQVWTKKWSHEEALDKVSAEQVEALNRQEFSADALLNAKVLVKGLAASGGAAVGRVAFSSEKALQMSKAGEKVVLVRPDTSPDDFSGMMASVAIVTKIGGTSCHAAVVAQELGIPAIVGAGNLKLHGWRKSIHEGDVVSVDGYSGTVMCGDVKLMEKPDLGKEVNIFLRWCDKSFHQRKPINFALAKERMSVNQALNDFYLVSAMAEKAKGNSLVRSARELRNRVHGDIADNFICYLAIAVSSELTYPLRSRSRLTSKIAKGAVDELVSSFDLIQHRSIAPNSGAEVLEGKSVEEQARFFELAAHAFSDSSQVGGGVSGPRWAAIAQAGFYFLSGEIAPMLFVDRVFDLRHNGGVLFNKHHMVTALTNEYRLHEQLDAKKVAKSIEDLRKSSEFVSYGGIDGVLYSSEVEDLWERGVKAKLW